MTNIKKLTLTTAKKYSGHGIPNLFAATNTFSQVGWLLSICISTAFCCFYIVNSFTDYYAYDVITYTRVEQVHELNFPSFIICSWGTEYPISEAIFDCKFNSKVCLRDQQFERVTVLGKGTTAKRYCIRFNGKKDNSTLEVVNKIGYDNGLAVSFLVPDEVSLIERV